MMRNLMFKLMFGLIAIGMLMPTLDSQAGHVTILVVSDQAAAGSLDTPLVTFLEGLDYTVDTSGMGQAMRQSNGGPTLPANAAAIAAADLVLMTRATSSLQYGTGAGDGGTLVVDGWNAITKPMLLMNGFLIRDSRLGWMTGSSIAQVANDVEDFIPEAGHPYAAGLSNPSAIFDWTTPATGSLDQLPSESDLLAGSTSAGTLAGQVYAYSIPAGTASTAGSLLPFGGRRGFVAAWSYPSGASGGPTNYGAPNMTVAHEMLLSNAISTLLIPEPSSSLLLMLGATVFGVVRRRNG